VLILSNKQDVPGALDELQLSQALGLDQGTLSYCSNKIVKCTASKSHNNNAIDPAIKKGLQWLIATVSGSWSSINARVIADSKSMDEEYARRSAATSRNIAQRKQARREKREADEKIASEGVGGVNQYFAHEVSISL
jgi:hypothetical protein